MRYYPVFLDLTGRRCIVIGGGVIAERKVDRLLAAGAHVTVVSPEISEGLRRLILQPSLKHLARKYERGDLAGFAIAFVATDDGTINADDPSHCDFISPAVIRRGELSVALSTGGASPASARAVREQLESYLSEEFAQLVQTASEVRRELRQRSIRASPEAWNEALKGEFRLLLRQGKAAEAKQLLLAQLEERSCD
jgi:siroheme synthase (precorrin-2 oxidase/ferrochelatase)